MNIDNENKVNVYSFVNIMSIFGNLLDIFEDLLDMK